MGAISRALTLWSGVAVVAIGTMVGGCSALGMKASRGAATSFWGRVAGTAPDCPPDPTGGSFWELNLVGALGVLIAFVSLLAKALGAPIPKKLIWTAVLSSVGAWVMRAMLVEYLWIVALMSIIGAAAGMGGLIYLRWDRIIIRLKGKPRIAEPGQEESAPTEE